MRRRGFLRGLSGGALSSWFALQPKTARAAELSFDHGVASGDPLQDRVILWTRVSGLSGESQAVRWRVASDPDMRSILNEGSVTTHAARDYTVKVDADHLPSGTELYYQFYAAGVTSPVGHTRTLPSGTVNDAAFAVVSCANYPYGYFHVYRAIAARKDLAAVLHLGDYIYEYGMGGYATEQAEALGRVPDPVHELQALDDYRRRHAQYKSDPDSIAMHAAHPLIAIWDDHELGNDAWRGGAQNHQADEGSWEQRRDAAIQAWLEWMPVRVAHDRGDTRIFRRFDYGDLLSLVMLDTRLYGRDRQPDVGDKVTAETITAAMRDPSRRLLGEHQESWLRRALQSAENSIWQIVGQQVMLMPVRTPDLAPLVDTERDSIISAERLERSIALSKDNPPLILDTWNGYPLAREDFLRDLEKCCSNPVVLSGDLHTCMAGNLIPRDRDYPVAVEFMTGSVTSPGFAEYLPEKRPGALSDATVELNPFLRYMETARRGWLCLQVSRQACTAEWHLVDDVRSREYRMQLDRRFTVRAGRIAEGLVPG